MLKYVEGFFQYRGLLVELVSRDIKTRYRRSYLGILWTVLNPLLMMVVLTVVFSTLFVHSIHNFPVYFLSGRVLFDFFSQATRDSTVAIVRNSSLITKIYIPKYIFPLSKVMSAFINVGFAMLALLAVMLATGAPFFWTILLFPIPLFYLLGFCIGLGLLLAAITVFFRDIEHLYGIFLTLLMYMTPLFYPVSILPERFLIMLQLNPLYHYVKMFRDVVYLGTLPSLESHLLCLSMAIIALVLGGAVFYKLQDRFILHI